MKRGSSRTRSGGDRCRLQSGVGCLGLRGSRVLNHPNMYIVVGALLNRYSKGETGYYGYSYGYLHVVCMLTGMTTTIIKLYCIIKVRVVLV